MTKKKFNTVEKVIQYELRRHSFADICERWGISASDLEDFINLANERFEQLENSREEDTYSKENEL